MFLIFKGEMLHRRKYMAKRTKNLCYERYLQVEVLADDTYPKGTDPFAGIHLHLNLSVRELEIGTAEPEVPCCVHELHEIWDGKRGLLEEENLELLKAGGGDPTK